jgi:hypothetical protein
VFHHTGTGLPRTGTGGLDPRSASLLSFPPRVSLRGTASSGMVLGEAVSLSGGRGSGVGGRGSGSAARRLGGSATRRLGGSAAVLSGCSVVLLVEFPRLWSGGRVVWSHVSDQLFLLL